MGQASVVDGPASSSSRSYTIRTNQDPRQYGLQPDDIELASLPDACLTQPVEVPATPAHQDQTQLAASAASHEAGALGPTQPAAADSDERLSLPAYSFFHSFHVAKCAVNVVKFAPGSADLLAWGAADGIVYLATAEQPARLLQVLDRHREKVTDLDWSQTGDLLLSCSLDGTACLWETASGRLVRTMRNLTGPLGCCRFHPANPNLLLLGTSAGELLALNASTGRMVAKAELQAAPMSGVGACCLEAAGPEQLLVADSRGCLHLFSAQLQGGMLQQLQLLGHFLPPVNRYHEPACLEYVAHSAVAGGPAVLLALSSGEVTLSRLLDKPWRCEQQQQQLRIPQASVKIRCSLRAGGAPGHPELLVAGSEDGRVHLLDLGHQPPLVLAGLSAHRAPVIGVCWNRDGSRIASCDKQGMVVVWASQAQPSGHGQDTGKQSGRVQSDAAAGIAAEAEADVQAKVEAG